MALDVNKAKEILDKQSPNPLTKDVFMLKPTPENRNKIMEILDECNDYERESVFTEITEKYCIHCGTNDPSCQCTNDD